MCGSGWLRGRARGRLQRRVVLQDGPLQLLQGRARLDAELVDERAASLPVGLQGLRLPAGPVQRRHEVAPQALPERMLRDQRLQLPDELAVPAEREVGVDAQLDGRQPDLLEPRDRSARRSARTRRRRAPARATGGARRAAARTPRPSGPGAGGSAASSTRRSKRWRSSSPGWTTDHVARRPGPQHVVRQRLAQARDVDSQRSGGPLGCVIAPQVVDQPVGGHDLVGVQQERREQRAWLVTAEGNGGALVAKPPAVPGSGTPSRVASRADATS